MKQTLKSEIFEKRKALSKEGIKEKSNKIKEKLFSLPEFKDAKNILFYVSFNDEVDTHEIIKELLANKEKNIIVPYVVKNNPILQLSEIKNFNELEPKTWGILEPKDEFIRKFDIENVDLVIIPGIVFDQNGHRIGYGYGYYDRFLKKLDKNVVKIGFGFEFQIVDKIPEEKHDVPVDIMVTEKRVINCNEK
ncbi:MAG: 5-formyltetrahydrofolate cyclo-ligase [Candidatus Woesearchaeota archaeon]|jgi:5-formyltetrahydrofolate cyclo-ligase|nr:5-formyltetrahydrofolate cyclo-ligase [Candidatus Woesearchaeota archaeon]